MTANAVGEPLVAAVDFRARPCVPGDALLTKSEVFGAFGGVFGDAACGAFGGQLTGGAAVDGCLVPAMNLFCD